MSRSKEPAEERAPRSTPAPPSFEPPRPDQSSAILALQRTAGNRAVAHLVGRRTLQRGPPVHKPEPEREYEPDLSVERIDRRRFKVRYGKDVLGTVEVEGAAGPGSAPTQWLDRKLQFLDRSMPIDDTIGLEILHDSSVTPHWRPSKGYAAALKRHGLRFSLTTTAGKPPFPRHELDIWPAPGHKPREKLPPLEDDIDLSPDRQPGPSEPPGEPEPVIRDTDEPAEVPRPKRHKSRVEELVEEAVDIITDFVPGVSNAKDFTTFLTGVNPVTGEKVGWFGRILALIFAIPVLGNFLKWAGKGTGRILKKLFLRFFPKIGRAFGKAARWLARGAGWLKAQSGRGLAWAGEKLGKAGKWVGGTWPGKQLKKGWKWLKKRLAKEGEWRVFNEGPYRPNTFVPRWFDIEVGGEVYKVHANATKHLAEYALSRDVPRFPMSAFASAIEEAEKRGLKPGQRNFLNMGEWELGIDTADNVIYHAVYRPRSR